MASEDLSNKYPGTDFILPLQNQVTYKKHLIINYLTEIGGISNNFSQWTIILHFSAKNHLQNKNDFFNDILQCWAPMFHLIVNVNGYVVICWNTE